MLKLKVDLEINHLILCEANMEVVSNKNQKVGMYPICLLVYDKDCKNKLLLTVRLWKDVRRKEDKCNGAPISPNVLPLELQEFYVTQNEYFKELTPSYQKWCNVWYKMTCAERLAYCYKLLWYMDFNHP